MSDTPETDALMDVWRVGKLLSVSVMLDHARKLERERDEARAEHDEWIARFRADEQLIKEAMEKHE